MLPENVSIERRQLLEVFGAEIILVAGRRGLERRRAPGPGAGRRAPRVGVPLPVRQRGQPPGPLRGAPAPRSGATAPRSPTSSPASARAARSWASGTLPQGAEPRRQGLRRRAAARASWSRACATSTTATSRRCSRSGAAPTCSTASASCGPASRSSGPAAWSSVGVFAGISPGAALAGAAKVAERDRRGHDRVRRVRRRLEVPLHRRLDRRPRRGRRPGRATHRLLGEDPHGQDDRQGEAGCGKAEGTPRPPAPAKTEGQGRRRRLTSARPPTRRTGPVVMAAGTGG